MDYQEWQESFSKPRKIKRNAIKCLKCGDVLESKYRHDFQMCSCHSVFVDGGKDYCRVGGNLGDIEFLTEFEEETANGTKEEN